MRYNNVDFFEDGYESAIKHLWINNIIGVESHHIMALKKGLGNVWNVYDAGENVLKKYVPEQIARRVFTSKSGAKIVELYDRLKEKDISIIYPELCTYPYKLRHINVPPQLLYVKGRIKNTINEYNKTIAIVGSRSPSVYGKEVCGYFSKELSKAGFNIVSGLARGIDGIAHRATLDNEGYTVAVLGSGINVAYPRSNIETYTRIQENGAIISEYGLDVMPNSWQFPIRNRIISGLSDGVLVVEARAESGSLITAYHAAEQGRLVYAIPGRLMDKNCEGNNSIIREGAICVTKPEDIIEDMIGVLGVKDKKAIKNDNCNVDTKDDRNKRIISTLSEEEQRIMSCLSLEPLYIDDIIQQTRLGVTKTISLLYVLEENKMVKQPMQGYFVLHI